MSLCHTCLYVIHVELIQVLHVCMSYMSRDTCLYIIHVCNVFMSYMSRDTSLYMIHVLHVFIWYMSYMSLYDTCRTSMIHVLHLYVLFRVLFYLLIHVALLCLNTRHTSMSHPSHDGRDIHLDVAYMTHVTYMHIHLDVAYMIHLAYINMSHTSTSCIHLHVDDAYM